MPETRRTLLRALGGAAVLIPRMIPSVAEAARALGDLPPEEAARDEDFWFAVRQAFDLDARYLILNAGASNPSPRTVQDALVRSIEFVNGSPLINDRGAFYPQRETARRRIARLIGCSPDEVAITRNTTEAIQTVIFGLPLERGDEVVTTDYDYDSMINALRQRERRDGIVVRQIPLGRPPWDPDRLVAAFESAIGPRTRAILLCHVVDAIGQILPVRKVCEVAHARDVQVIVDGALGFGHIACDMEALGCDYYGTSLHKWASAPLGTGFLYVRRDRIGGLWPLYGDAAPDGEDIRKFERIGTHPGAHVAAINQALDFYEGIGVDRKQARLHYLKRRWTDKVKDIPRIRINTPLDPEMSCATVHVTIEGIDREALARYLIAECDIFVYAPKYKDLPGIYVSPNVFTRPEDLDRFAEVLVRVARDGLPA